MKEIAEAAGLKSSSIYYYFSGKDEILQALSNYTMSDFDGLKPEEEAHTGRAAVKLYQFILAHVARATTGPYDTWYQVQLTPAGTGRRRARYLAWRAYLKALVTRAIEQGDFRRADPEFVVHMIVGCIYGALELRHSAGIAAASETAETIVYAFAIDSDRAAAICACEPFRE